MGDTSECIDHGFGTIGQRRGYSQRRVGGDKKRYRHVLAWMEHHQREVPPGMMVMHLCHNARCVNVEHLRLGTPLENTRMMIAAGRAAWQKAKA